jgi:hypothetical protein
MFTVGKEVAELEEVALDLRVHVVRVLRATLLTRPVEPTWSPQEGHVDP